ncbi:STAS/SEC14 domain-containing protein [Shewanella sp. Scap07]|uniref:STAS/SEC14 domain-containing protein n=1 Tax=Shewanella sp. Scap07 TaxID=2589987 RepID=UPI0015BB8E36|nr:STAS/SEC14 domain-containing protein [Shewanella sp. Scap07]QLE85238.1 STAS/SEC14 domain-containing protein [Shewanella sp. Scap07]
MLMLLNEFSDNIVAVRLTNTVDSEDITSLLAEVQQRLQRYASVRIWYEFDKDFTSMTLGSLWEEATLSLFHLTDISRVVIISASEHSTGVANALAIMMPCQVEVFNAEQKTQARQWLVSDDKD